MIVVAQATTRDPQNDGPSGAIVLRDGVGCVRALLAMST